MDRTGVREAINWLYIRVQNARKMYVYNIDQPLTNSEDRF